MVKSKMFFLICITSLVLLFANESNADSVHLKNGDIMTGTIVSFADEVCVFNSSFGATVFFGADDITNLSTDRIYEIVFKNGDSLKGKFSISNDGKTTINTESFGSAPVKFGSVSKMTAVFEAKNSKTNEKKQEDQDKIEYGQKVDKEPPLDFLTGTTVLLRPGVFEFDMGISYKQSKTSYRLPYAGYFERSTFSARQLELGIGVRAGLWEGAEANVHVPFTYTQVTDVSTSEWARNKDRYSIGDISFGLQQTLLRETANRPAITASLNIMAPTGEKTYQTLTDSWLEPLDSGRGFWTVSPGLSFVKSIDPAIIFGGINYQYSFENTISGYRAQPGWGISGYLGVGFALNDDLSLGARVSQAYFSDMKYNGKIIEGTFTEPMDLAFTASYRLFESWVVSPEVRFGLNDDAGAPSIGLRFTRRF